MNPDDDRSIICPHCLRNDLLKCAEGKDAWRCANCGLTWGHFYVIGFRDGLRAKAQANPAATTTKVTDERHETITEERVMGSVQSSSVNSIPDTFAIKTAKPPLGVMPQSEWLRQRVQELSEAIARYAAEGKPVLKDWTEELHFIVCSGKA